jgi:hypothetical protein
MLGRNYATHKNGASVTKAFIWAVAANITNNLSQLNGKGLSHILGGGWAWGLEAFTIKSLECKFLQRAIQMDIFSEMTYAIEQKRLYSKLY